MLAPGYELLGGRVPFSSSIVSLNSPLPFESLLCRMMYNEFKRASSADTVIFYARVRIYSGVELQSC